MVQDFGVEMLLYLDGRKTSQAEADSVKAALVASGKWRAQPLFPDFFPEERDESNDPGGDVVYDYTEVKWESPETTGIEEFEQLQKMMRDSGVTLMDEEDGPAAFFDAGEAAESAEWI